MRAIATTISDDMTLTLEKYTAFALRISTIIEESMPYVLLLGQVACKMKVSSNICPILRCEKDYDVKKAAMMRVFHEEKKKLEILRSVRWVSRGISLDEKGMISTVQRRLRKKEPNDDASSSVDSEEDGKSE